MMMILLLLLLWSSSSSSSSSSSMVYAQNKIRPREWNAKNCLWFEIKIDHLNPGRRPDLMIVNKKKNLLNSGLCHSGDHEVKIKENKKETNT